MTPLDIVSAVIVPAIWGVNFVVAKAALGELPPLLFIALRFALVALILVPFAPRPSRAALPHLAGLAFTLGAAHFALLFAGLVGVEAGLASVLAQVQVPAGVLAAWALLGDKVGPRDVAGFALAVAGIWLVTGGGRGDVTHVAMCVGAACIWGIANVQTKWLGARGPMHPATYNGWVGLFAAPMLGVESLLFEHGQRAALAAAGWVGWGGVAYTAIISTIVAYGLWFRLIGRYRVSACLPFTMLVPVFGLFGGAALLGEGLTRDRLVGAVVTVAGVALTLVRRAPPLAPAAVAETA